MTPAQDRPNPMRYKQTIHKLEKSLQDSLKDLGVKTYRLISKGDLDAPPLATLIGKIEGLLNEIDQNKRELEEFQVARKIAKGGRCPYCGWSAPAGVSICLSCGRDMYAQAFDPGAPALSPTELKPCLHCGKEIAGNSTFCGFCGKTVEPQVSPKPQEVSGVMNVPFNVPAAPVLSPTELKPCLHCGKEIAGDAAFCGYCGKTVEEHVSPKPEETSRVMHVQDNNADSPLVNAQPSPNEPYQITAPVTVEAEAATSSSPNMDQAASPQRCPHCGEEVVPGATICVNCGKQLIAAQVSQGHHEIGSSGAGRCPNCGDALEQSATFCVSCGRQL